jgi:hypothetical protein
MRRLLYLFSLYILLLSGIPCKADDGCCVDEISATSAQHKNSFPDQRPALPCSPFFACGACHGFIIPEMTLPHPEPVPRSRKQTHYFTDHYLGDFSSSTWQPPRQA